MPRDQKITVSLGQLTKPLQVKKIDSGTTLGDFLGKEEISFNSRVRVNAEAEKESYRLREDDIITVVGEVSGG